MIIKEILSDCVLKLGYSNRLDVDNSESWTEEEQKIIDTLLRCVNIIYAEICTNYIPNITCETVNLVNNIVAHNTLNNKLVYSISLKQNGITKKIKQYPSYIESNFSGDGILEYVCLPDKLTLTSDVSNTIPSWLIADGVVSEFAYANNMMDMAMQHERKFRDGLSWLNARGCSKYVKARRWL